MVGKRLPYCGRCFGRGLITDKKTKRHSHCPCGRTNPTAELKLARQLELDNRLEEIKETGKW